MRSEDVRLVTLIGPPGVGKTRLALETLRRLSEFRVCFVDLSPIRDPALVAPAIAQALGVMESPDRSILRRLFEYFRGRALLLILDNFEQVVDAALQIGEPVETCPTLKIIATSREPLHLTWEREIQVNPLALPDRQHPDAPERLGAYSAIALFVARARAVQPSFALSDQNSATIADICTILDGLPLAVEMAAAQVKAMPPQVILSRLQRHLTELSTDLRDVPDRHRTLRNAISWSYELLAPREQVLFRRLGVFVGGCTLDAVEAVCSDADTPAAEVVEMLAALVDKSLLRHEGCNAGAPRFRLLQTLQDFGLDALRRHHELTDLQARHATHYVQLAEHATHHLWGAEQGEWLDRLEAEHDNFRAALTWSPAAQDHETELRLAGSLGYFWYIRGHWSEGRRHLMLALEGTKAAPSLTAACALWGAANLAWRQGDIELSASMGKDALALSRKFGDHELASRSLLLLARVAYLRGNLVRAKALCAQSLALSRRMRHEVRAGVALIILGDFELEMGDLAQAAAHTRDGLALQRRTGHLGSAAHALQSLARIALKRKNVVRAETYARESLALCRTVKDRWITKRCLEILTATAAARGDYRRATRRLGTVTSLTEALGLQRPADQTISGRLVMTLRARFAEAEFNALWTAARQLTADEAIDEALAEQAGAPTLVAAGRGNLTGREWEVAQLIAAGHSNKAIAARLFIGTRTTDTHVQHILNKLGFSSRAQIAVWVAGQSLSAVPPRNT